MTFPDYPAVFIGALHSGRRVTTINALFTVGEIRYQLADCGAGLIVTVPEMAGKAAEAAAGLPVRDVANPLDRREQVRPGSAGPLAPGGEGKFLDLATGAELGPGEQGELWLRGPNVMSGYLNRPDDTAATVVDGWLRTGDIGYADPDGWIYVVDHAKELIKYKAFAVAPAELEALLVTHPAVLDAAVVPSPDTDAGEVPKAFVVTRADVDLTELESWVARQVAPHKRIRRFELVAEIPRTPSGKILRRVLIEQERAAARRN